MHHLQYKRYIETKKVLGEGVLDEDTLLVVQDFSQIRVLNLISIGTKRNNVPRFNNNNKFNSYLVNKYI